eukprot:6456040-Lingulodinium_polyedra.AAC.1
MTRTPRTIALLSMFDGTGMVRLGLDDLLRRIDATGALVASGFAELDPTPAQTVDARWGDRARLALTLPHRRLGHNVWEPLRNGARILREFLGE